MAEVYGIDDRKARKEHKCCECHGLIKSGEVYKYHHGVHEGQGFSGKVCVDCEALRDDVNKEYPLYEQACLEMLWEHVFEDDNASWMKRFIETKKKRGAKVQDWMQNQLDEAEEDAKHTLKL